MDFIYSLVTNSNYWESRYHKNFFIDNGAFTSGFLWALAIGVIIAIAFYFSCCNSKKTSKSATSTVWACFMVLAAVLTYVASDFYIIGTKDSSNGTKDSTSGFYQANEDYFIKISRENSDNEQLLKELSLKKDEIRKNLNDGGDARFDFSITNVLLCCLFFYLASIVIKNFTISGKTIPHKFPMRS